MCDPAYGAKQEFQRAMEKLECEIREGMSHGFFELSVACEVIKDGKRRLIIRTGKSYQFVIPEEKVRVSKVA
jgi:hypothetical protein